MVLWFYEKSHEWLRARKFVLMVYDGTATPLKHVQVKMLIQCDLKLTSGMETEELLNDFYAC